ncbi:transcriptional regulator [Paenibacillus beijingensis]|uniref:HTH-type transcriptional regulator n=1 Tax=Paenibacillus beijingensis TaxID=1126833 RepID=A0A0D5NQU5_9BACL|nr:transcriptional regulator [Paenibacillus beijingensis]
MLKEAENVIIDAIADTMDQYGVTHSIGRLYGVMYLSDSPMTLDEMSDKLGLSKPRMSTAVHSLIDIHMIQKVWRKGERKDLYEAEKDFFRSFISFFCMKWEREISVNLEAITKANEKLAELMTSEAVPDVIRDKAQKNVHQLEESIQYYNWLKKLVHTFKSKEIFAMLEL